MLCLALFNCGYNINYPHVTLLPTFFWVGLLTLGQSCDCLVSGMWIRTFEGHHTSRPWGWGVGFPWFLSLLIVGLFITALYRIRANLCRDILTAYRWFGAGLQWLECVCNGVAGVLHWAIDILHSKHLSMCTDFVLQCSTITVMSSVIRGCDQTIRIFQERIVDTGPIS